jgi:hypothetical protein
MSQKVEETTAIPLNLSVGQWLFRVIMVPNIIELDCIRLFKDDFSVTHGKYVHSLVNPAILD